MIFTILRFGATVAVALATVGVSHAGHGGVPKNPPPHAGRAIIQGDQLLLAQSLTVCAIETRTRTVIVNGQNEEQTYAVTCPQSVQGMRQVIGGDYRVMTVGGERLTEKQAAERLAAETDVLVSTSGKLLDPAYQKLYPLETLIIHLRPEPPCGAPFGGPPPVAAPVVAAPVVAAPVVAAPAEGPPPPVAAPVVAAPAQGPPPPKFPQMPPAKGSPPTIGWMNKEGDQIFISLYSFRSVIEQQPVTIEIKDVEGNSRIVTKMKAVTHWLLSPQVITTKTADLIVLDRAGKPQPEGAARLTDGVTTVLVLPPGAEFEPAHFKHFQPELKIVQAELPVGPVQNFVNSLPPHEMFAKVVGDKLTVFKPVYETRVRKVPVTVIVDGKALTEYKQEFYTVTKSVGLDYSLADVTSSDAVGKPVDAATLAKRLAKESPVLVWENGTPIGDIYLAPLKPETLNLVLPPWSPPAPLAPGAAPPPALELPGSGLPPRFALAQHFGNVLVLREPQPMTVQFPKTVQKTVDGKVVTETVYENRVETHWHEYAVSAENYRVADVSGKLLDEALAFGRLNKETMVLISEQGKRVDPAWLAIYKPAAVVVYLRPQTHGGFGGPAPAPAPPNGTAPPAPAPFTHS